MKRFLRDRKPSIDSKSRPVVSAPAPLAKGSGDTPLYARFATVHRGHDNGGPTKPVVSGPMHLSSKNSFSHGNPANVASNQPRSRGSDRVAERAADRHSKVLSRQPSSVSKEDSRQKLTSSSSTRSPSRPAPAPKAPPPVPKELDVRISFPAAQTTDDEGYAIPPMPRMSTFAMERTKSESTDSEFSDSFTYSPPPRQLVVRNMDPENDSLLDTPPTAPPPLPPSHAYPSHSAVAPQHAGMTSPMSPSSSHTRLHQSGYDMQRPAHMQTASLGAMPPNSRYPISPIPPGNADLSQIPQYTVQKPPDPASRASRIYSDLPPIPQPQHHHQALRQSSFEQSHARGQSSPEALQSNAPPQHKLSLLSTPSVSRKNYSPLAAFGLPVSQVSSSASLVPSTRSASIHNEPQAHPSDGDRHRSIGPTPALEPQPVPLLPPIDVPSSSFQLPHLEFETSDWRKTVTDRETKRASRVEDIAEPPRRSYHDPGAPPPYDEYGYTNRQAIDESTITPSRPQPLARESQESNRHVAPTPLRPTSGSSQLAARLSASLPPIPPPPQPSLPSSTTPTNSSQESMPDVGRTRFQSSQLPDDTLPPLPPPAKHHHSKSREPQSYAGDGGHTVERSSSRRISPNPPPAPEHAQQGAHHRGRPLIFAAQEASAAPDAQEMHIEPEMVGLIANVSAAVRTEEAYNAHSNNYQQQGYQTPNSTPPPPPEHDESGHRRKLSKQKKNFFSRKAVPTDNGSTSDQSVRDEQRRSEEREAKRSLRRPSDASPLGKHKSAQGAVGPPSKARDDQERLREDVDRHGRKKSTSHDSKANRRSRDGVKMLTDKQMEKLIQRSSHGSSPTKSAEPNMPLSRRPSVEERPAAYPPPPHKLSYKSTHPVFPTYTPEPPASAPPPQRKLSGRSAKLSLSHGSATTQVRHIPQQLPTPPDDYMPTPPPERRERSRREKTSSPPVPVDHSEAPSSQEASSQVADPDPPEPKFYPLVTHLADQVLLENLLAYFSFYDWLMLAAVSRDVRRTLYVEGREPILERFLRSVGYTRWQWNSSEPLMLTVEDLCHYIRGVSTPLHRYADIATSYVQSKSSVDQYTMLALSFSCRAFTRVVLRLRAQAEAEAAYVARMGAPEMSYSNVNPRTRTFSNATTACQTPSKWSSQSSLNRSSDRAPSPSSSRGTPSGPVVTFHSPLFRLRRAPLLQVFVPSPDGDWLSDDSVVLCETELKRAGVMHMLRPGDVVWDVAVGDEANVGRLVWDGNYLIDLDYTYSRVGDPPRYLPTLAFPPSYFHRVIRTMGTGNPVVRIDLSPWGDQINANVQLIQDKMRTETPQGGRHTVIRWVYRSSFVIRPPPGSRSIRLPMPNKAGPGPSPTGAWIVDPDWFGTVVVETEGTTEGLGDLQARCQPLPPLRGPPSPERAQWEEKRLVFRILRERSRPGEIWIRVLTDKERIIS